MPPVMLKGAAVKSLNIGFEEKVPKIQGMYHLESSTGTCVAKQNFNGYSDMVVEWSPATLEKINAAINAMGGDINKLLGFEGDSQ